MCEIALLSLISDLYFPISSLLSSHLPLLLFGAHTVWRGMMNTQLSKAHMLGVLLFYGGPITSHMNTQVCTHPQHYFPVKV